MSECQYTFDDLTEEERQRLRAAPLTRDTQEAQVRWIIEHRQPKEVKSP